MSKCTNCAEDVPQQADRCVACYSDAGAPNVRQAALADEELALTNRVRNAEERAAVRGCSAKVDELRARLEGTHVVLCRPWGVADRLLRSSEELIATFYEQLRQHSRLPENNDFDRWRIVVDQTFFPFYFEKLRFAALSTTGEGVPKYGGCAIVLKDRSIEERSTVFEENTFEFWDRHMQRKAEEPPHGFRAVWKRRADLGVAKLADRVQATMTTADLDTMILAARQGSVTDDFLEVQIYGTLHRGSVVAVSGKKPKKAADRALVASLRRDLQKLGIEVKLQ
jgi:hypothetical protein